MKKIENEEVRPLVLHDDENGRTYTLEFSRETVKEAESRGFSLEDLSRYPMTKTYEFFWLAFRMHHKNVSREKTDRIIDNGWGGVGAIPDGVLERLIQLYDAPFNTMKDGEERPKTVTVEF